MTTPVAVLGRIWPIVAAVTLGMLSLGTSLPVIPQRVHDALGYGPVVVGIAVSIQSAMTLLTRQYAGGICDRTGPRAGMLIGTAGAAVSGAFYFLSWVLPLSAPASLAVLLVGRITMGFAESFIITSGLTWGIMRVPPQLAGQAMAWNGLAFFLAIAIGAPIGTVLQAIGGFALVSLAALAVPLLGFAICAVQPPTQRVAGLRVSFWRVVGLITVPGFGLLLGNIGFGCIASFVVLDFAQKGWAGGAAALGAYGGAFVIPRLVLGGVPDRASSPGPIIITLTVAAFGQFLLFAAPHPAVAIIGAILTGLGTSLVFPLFGVPAMRRVPPQSRGSAIGAYNAFMDCSLGLAGPIAGIIATHAGLPSVFLFGTACALAGILPAMLTYRLPAVAH
jgi:MFS family permease